MTTHWSAEAIRAEDEALLALRDSGFQAISEDALVVRLRDEPGALAKIAVRFKDADLNVRSIRFLRHEDGYAWVTIVTQNNARAAELLEEHPRLQRQFSGSVGIHGWKKYF